jgi:hypothetical protein
MRVEEQVQSSRRDLSVLAYTFVALSFILSTLFVASFCLSITPLYFYHYLFYHSIRSRSSFYKVVARTPFSFFRCFHTCNRYILSLL